MEENVIMASSCLPCLHTVGTMLFHVLECLSLQNGGGLYGKGHSPLVNDYDLMQAGCEAQ